MNPFHPDFRADPYWWDAAPPETTEAEPLPAEVEFLIVGSGFAGLSAALEAARAGVAVAVLDGGPLGGGASSRSGGMVSSGQKLVLTEALRGLPAEKTQAALEDSKATFEFLKDLVRREGLDADLQLTGRFFGAFTPAHLATLHRNAETLRAKTGVTIRILSRAEQRAEVGSDYFHGGFVVEDYGGVHPAKLNQALRGAARAAGAALHSHARVLGTTRRGDGRHEVRTSRGTVLAGHVLFATNGYTDAASPWLHRRIIPVMSYQIATEPLPRALMDQLIPHRRMVTDSRKELTYTRPSPDGTRILFGCRPRALQAEPETLALRLRDRMLRIWPELADYRITHAWGGFVGMTADRLPHIAEHEGVMHAVGCNGNGVALMTFLGWHATQLVLGRTNRRAFFADIPFPALPLPPAANPVIVPVMSAAYHLRDFAANPAEVAAERLGRPRPRS
ncbi:FAD-dependent oxidoreductase [Belnapia sp. T6]|uniref:FAD-dependent oxidoreductase n=1 Tax=Belnapia mucosa TaxID=2804532 RepID=A0ABS1V4N5_9PROT|nr:FAD-dependent oxidoreductase [Belnapia mucosa]MBL6456552.1 FAD-dependent oxidoreductase [Belnapia mucosa]